MAKLGPFGLIPETEDFLEEELRDLRLKMEHPEEWEEKERKRKEAAEIARRKVEEAKNLPADYFDAGPYPIRYRKATVSQVSSRN